MTRGNWGFPGRGPFEQMHDFGGAHILGMILMIILWAAIIAAIVIGIRALIIHSRRGNKTPTAIAPLPPAGGASPPSRAAGGTNTAPAVLAILEERYARGEIGREDFLQRKADLGFMQPEATPPAGPVVSPPAETPSESAPTETST
jgi:putative membrane protein